MKKLSQVALDILQPLQEDLVPIQTRAPGAGGRLPMTAEFLRNSPCGDVFGWMENVGQGWDPADFGKKQFLILSMNGGIRAKDGTPIALAYSTGQYEPVLLAEEAALEIKRLGAIPFASFVTEHCDGRMQSTPGMMDSLAYRNDAAILLRRLIRCLPGRQGVLGVANCDKGLPAMMMALAAMKDLASVVVPGGVTLPPVSGEDAGKVQSLPARFARGEVTLEYAQEVACTACASAGGSCQFLGTASTAQVVAEALGVAVLHSALAPSGQALWLALARSSVRALLALEQRGITIQDVLTEGAIRNAMAVHAAFGGSMNLLLHLPAIAHAAGLRRPTVEDWTAVNRRVPRLVDVLPNGPRNHPTVQVYLAGGVPEVMLRLRELDVLDLDVLTVTGDRLGSLLEQWQQSQRRTQLRDLLQQQDGVDPEDVILSAGRARKAGLTGTVTFPRGNIAPQGSVIKSTAIDPSVVDADGVYRKRGPAKVFVRETAVLEAIKSGEIQPSDVILLICDGPLGSGMEEVYEVTASLKHLAWGKHVALITDARFSGVSTGACIGHVGPEALAGGPIGKVLDGDVIDIVIDRGRLSGQVNLIGQAGDPPETWSIERGNQLLANRPLRPDLAALPGLPDDTRLWALLQEACGGTWGGCVYDVDTLAAILAAGRKAKGE
jgi:putative YjhG/YagF family dehydratase